MKEEYVLERLNEIAQYMDEKEIAFRVMREFMEYTKEQICRQEMKNAGTSGVYAAAKRFVRDCAGRGIRSEGAYTAPDGNQYICDGYRIAKFYQPMELQKLPDGVEPYDYESFIEGAKKDGWFYAALPDVGKLRAAIKVRKAENKASGKSKIFRKQGKTECVWYFPENESYFNAEYLLDMLEMFPNARAAVGNKAISTMYLEAENGEGILLPIRPDRGDEPLNYNMENYGRAE